MSLSHHVFTAKTCLTSIIIHVYLYVLTTQRWLIILAVHASLAKFGMGQCASIVAQEEAHGIKIPKLVYAQLTLIGMAMHVSFVPSAKHGFLLL